MLDLWGVEAWMVARYARRGGWSTSIVVMEMVRRWRAEKTRYGASMAAIPAASARVETEMLEPVWARRHPEAVSMHLMVCLVLEDVLMEEAEAAVSWWTGRELDKHYGGGDR